MTRPSRPPDRPLLRRDPDGTARTASSWESLTERLIREAQEAGQFDDLSGRGAPLPVVEDGLAGDMALAYHVLHNAGAVPPWIEADKQVRRLRASIEDLFERAGRAGALAHPRLSGELEALACAHDDAVKRLESLAPTTRQQRRRIDRAGLRDRLAAMMAEAP